jgi:hypothetical protein
MDSRGRPAHRGGDRILDRGHGPEETNMTVERGLRFMAGTFVMLSVILAMVHSPNWLWFTLFVGFNLTQSAITNWCPMVWILSRLGFATCAPVVAPAAARGR